MPVYSGGWWDRRDSLLFFRQTETGVADTHTTPDSDRHAPPTQPHPKLGPNLPMVTPTGRQDGTLTPNTYPQQLAGALFITLRTLTH